MMPKEGDVAETEKTEVTEGQSVKVRIPLAEPITGGGKKRVAPKRLKKG